MHQLERKILRLSTIVLLLSLLVVYALFYQVKWVQIQNRFWSDTNVADNTTRIYIQSGDEKQLVGSLNLNKTDVVKSGLLKKIILTWSLITWNIWNKTGDEKLNSEIKYLSWTQLFYGVLESIAKLCIPYKYILEDKKMNILYISMRF